jgi:hypothetical protein
MEVAERLAAHRSRRGGNRVQAPLENARAGGSAGGSAKGARAARIAAIVAERYAQTQSYRAYLAAEAERAVQQAQAAAEAARLNAEAMLAAQRSLLDQLNREGLEAEAARVGIDDARAREALLHRDCAEETEGVQTHAELQALPQELLLWPNAESEEPKHAPRRRAAASGRRCPAAKARAWAADSFPLVNAAVAEGTLPQAASPSHGAEGGLRIQMHGEAAQMGLANAAVRASGSALRRDGAYDQAEALALDEEIAFRQAPVFEEPAGPPLPLPANLIEFPRQLVASRKARPRLAEGPLREVAENAPGAGQLRIFEVDSAQIDTAPAPAPAAASAAMPQWTSIWLDAPGAFNAGERAEDSYALAAELALGLPEVASIRRRVVASAIDGGIILAGVLGAAAAFVLASCHSVVFGLHGVPLGLAVGRGVESFAAQTGLPAGMALAASAVTFALLYMLYQALFFSLSEATPGMGLARIALCTFSEENPARSALRRRIVAILLSACPLGLGFLWAVLDEERLTWHDRASGMYQRSY